MPRFIPNRNLGRDLQRESAAYAQGLAQAAKPAAAAARQLAPVDTGDYRDSIQVTVDGSQVRLESTDPFAHLVEWGSVNNAPHAPLRRGVRAAGLRFEER